MDVSTFLLQGGLDLVTPPVAMPPGRVSAALNYEPDVAGYRRFQGYERYDGHPSPSSGADDAEVETLRAAISAVPGSGPVRGVQVYRGTVYAFRDSEDGGSGKMYRATAAGWSEVDTGSHILTFNTGSVEFTEGAILTGGTSGALGLIVRLVQQSGDFGAANDAVGYLVLVDITGTFTPAEAITDSVGGAAVCVASQSAVTLQPGGHYTFATHNFYGAAKHPRLYFASGADQAYEYDDDGWLAPVQSGTTVGTLDSVVYVFHRGADYILTRDGSQVTTRGEFDVPDFIGVFRNHLFLGYEVGSVIFSGIGEPLDFRALVGAGELSFGSTVTGFLTSASTAFVIFGANRIEYVTGNDSSDFTMVPITDNAGAHAYTAVMAGDQPIYLDDGGVRSLSTTAAFGDWNLGTITQLIEPLIHSKINAGVAPVEAVRHKHNDLYRLFYGDNSVITIYLGRKTPECMPLLLPIQVSCATAGEIDANEGESVYVGAEDGFVYEFDKGSSFDGAEIQAFVRLPWNPAGSTAQNKRFHRMRFELDAPEDMDIGVVFHVDYGMPGNTGTARQNLAIAAGTQPFLSTEDYDLVDWSQPAQGVFDAEINAVGVNVAASLVTEHTTEDAHILSSATIFSTPRGLRKTP
jgi:hypothetical protein